MHVQVFPKSLLQQSDFSLFFPRLGAWQAIVCALSAILKVEKLDKIGVKRQQFNRRSGRGALYSCESRQQNRDLEEVGETPGFVASATSPFNKAFGMLQNVGISSFPGCQRLLQLSPRSRTWKAKPTLGAP